jgi:hypothetical protein
MVVGCWALFVFVLWCLSVGPVAAYESEYFLFESKLPEKVKELEGEMKQEHLTLLGMTIGESTMPEIKQRFGPAEGISVGHDGVLICYRSAQHDDNTMVIFGTDIHGDQRLINFQLVAGQQPFKGKKQCALSLLVSKEVATNSGLKLGLNARTSRMIWDAPMMEKKGHLFLLYDYHKTTTYDGKPACDLIFATSVTRFVADELAWLLITRGTEGYLGPCIRSDERK